ncbi:UDP-N-acetylmuramate--L-alanine ligase [Adhaeribacter radiodurans]|uniref:UDP-N-acetylmuramate--L-alanine ligase n=1 Tax=Adhaeribacter radiodurans TaxID=2745197 RepID=A0A7L7L9J6_9BACT|nr:UDP-N-acetylmuramate--L-alanine ligase [Adhaeribacter radiodurans]QMU29404.1 UDP-N-acetylmuramate--L-alanine ligase [Adhaeribacter radiodurans]
MRTDKYKYIYFLGIGGIGMSAIARYFNAKGLPVWGYDKTPTPLTQALTEEGIQIHFEDNINLIPEEVKQNQEQTLVVLTPAIPADHREWQYLRENGFEIKKRSEVLGIITANAFTIAVAGTHGKTTTSSMIAHLLHHAGVNCSAFLGGISVNLNSNLLLGKDEDGREIIVVEADEYDRSFLRLFPDIAIVTSTDADHLDIYGDKEELIHSFQEFIGQIKPKGSLLLNTKSDSRVTAKIESSVKVLNYGLERAEINAGTISIEEHRFKFNVVTPTGVLPGLELAVPGFHNVENALAACVTAQLMRVPSHQIRAGVAAYRGVKRRFEFVAETQDHIYIDDYAHHPSEINAFVSSLKALFPDKKIKLIFQPHLFTRTRDFADEFAQSLSQVNEVELLEIYPAREKPIPGVTAEMLLNRISGPKKSLLSKQEVLDKIENHPDFDVVATVGAGDIDTLVQPIKNILEKKKNVSEA